MVLYYSGGVTKKEEQIRKPNHGGSYKDLRSMDWPDREIQAPFSYLQRMELGPMTSGSLVTLKALLSQRGFFLSTAHPAGIHSEEGTVIASAAKQSGLPRPLLAMTPPATPSLTQSSWLSPQSYPFPHSSRLSPRYYLFIPLPHMANVYSSKT